MFLHSYITLFYVFRGNFCSWWSYILKVVLFCMCVISCPHGANINTWLSRIRLPLPVIISHGFPPTNSRNWVSSGRCKAISFICQLKLEIPKACFYILVFLILQSTNGDLHDLQPASSAPDNKQISMFCIFYYSQLHLFRGSLINYYSPQK